MRRESAQTLTGLSRTWIEVAKRERWFVSGGLSIHYFDEWSESLVEVI